MAVRIFRQASRRRAAFADSWNVFDDLRSSTFQKLCDVDVLGEQQFDLDAHRHSHLSVTCVLYHRRFTWDPDRTDTEKGNGPTGTDKREKTKVLNSSAILQAGAKKRYPKLMAMILPNLDDFQDFDHWKIFKSKFADKCY